jgi:uncharacterized membrane protein YcaP (DUF421 family)
MQRSVRADARRGAAAATGCRERDEAAPDTGAHLAVPLIVFEIEGTKLLEIIARVAIIYIACMVLLRLSGRREMSELGPMDLLTMLLLSETVSPALTGGDESLPGALTAAAVLLALTVATSWLVRRSRLAGRVIEGHAVVLIDNGRVRQGVLQKFRITDEDLRAALHMQGLLHVGDVARAFVESDGKITIVKRSDHDTSMARTHRHPPHTGSEQLQ